MSRGPRGKKPHVGGPACAAELGFKKTQLCRCSGTPLAERSPTATTTKFQAYEITYYEATTY